MTRVVLLDSVDTWRECALGGILGWRASSDRADLVGNNNSFAVPLFSGWERF